MIMDPTSKTCSYYFPHARNHGSGYMKDITTIVSRDDKEQMSSGDGDHRAYASLSIHYMNMLSLILESQDNVLHCFSIFIFEQKNKR